MMFRLACYHCQAHLDAYIDNQLSPKTRRRVALHLDHCADCYALYTQQRNLRRDLQTSLPLVGKQGAPDFSRTWAAVRGELPRHDSERQRYRYGLVAVLLMLALLLPFTMGHRDIPMVMPARPAPDSLENSTPAKTEAVAVATVAASVTESHVKIATLLPTVPEPDFSRGRNGNDD